MHVFGTGPNSRFHYNTLQCSFHVVDFESLAGNGDDVVARAVTVEGEAHGAAGIEAYAFELGAIVDVGMAGEDGVNSRLFEER